MDAEEEAAACGWAGGFGHAERMRFASRSNIFFRRYLPYLSYSYQTHYQLDKKSPLSPILTGLTHLQQRVLQFPIVSEGLSLETT